MNEPHEWQRSVLSLVMPDAVVRHLATSIVERVEKEGFLVSYCRPLEVAPERLDALFETQLRRTDEAYRFRLLDRLFAFGPVIGLVYEDVSDSPEPAHERLMRIKGATDPRDAAPGTLRRDFGGINAMLNLVHIADQPAQSALEAELLFGPDEVAQDRPPRGSAEHGTDRESALSLLRMLETAPRESRSFDDVLAGHRACVLSACWTQLSAAARSAAAAALDGGALSEIGIGARIADGLCGAEAHPAYYLLRADWQPGHQALPERELLKALAGLGLPRDRWAELVLLTSACFAPIRWSGER